MGDLQRAEDRAASFFYDFLLTGQVPADPLEQEKVLRLLDIKIAAAKEFSAYLHTVEQKNAQVLPLQVNDQYQNIQKELSAEIVDGDLFMKLNQEFTNSNTENLKIQIKEMEAELDKCDERADYSKTSFKVAVAQLGQKADRLNFVALANLKVSDRALNEHLTKVWKWVLDIFYDIPGSKYQWENFREQVFLRDQGKDFKKRVSGLYFPKLYDYNAEACQYVLSTRPMFMKALQDSNLDLFLSLAEDIILGYKAREDYTNHKKTIAELKVKIGAANFEVKRSEKVINSSKPYITAIYHNLLQREYYVRNDNLSDFVRNNLAEHLFYKGGNGKIETFLRGQSLARYEPPVNPLASVSTATNKKSGQEDMNSQKPHVVAHGFPRGSPSSVHTAQELPVGAAVKPVTVNVLPHFDHKN